MDQKTKDHLQTLQEASLTISRTIQELYTHLDQVDCDRPAVRPEPPPPPKPTGNALVAAKPCRVYKDADGTWVVNDGGDAWEAAGKQWGVMMPVPPEGKQYHTGQEVELKTSRGNGETYRRWLHERLDDAVFGPERRERTKYGEPWSVFASEKAYREWTE